ncbi:MAG: flagellar hook basal-body protein [Nitrospinae bacterium]|nr:flagellar hook basal-body protein [Nitrospinota bacterium]
MKLPGVNAGLSGLQANANKVAVAANNIANMNTDAFRAQETVNQSLPSNQGVVTAAIRQVTQPGSPLYTGNPLDVAIQGEGFFQVRTPDGKNAYTRQGNFQPDNQGRLAVNGAAVRPEVKIPSGATNLNIQPDGSVMADVNGQQMLVGKLNVAKFNNPGGLQSIGNGLLAETAQSGAPASGSPGGGALGSLVPNSLESSNVDLATEIVNMMMAKQGYSANAKVVKNANDMAGTLLNIKT